MDAGRKVQHINWLRVFSLFRKTDELKLQNILMTLYTLCAKESEYGSGQRNIKWYKCIKELTIWNISEHDLNVNYQNFNPG